MFNLEEEEEEEGEEGEEEVGEEEEHCANPLSRSRVPHTQVPVVRVGGLV